MFPFRPLAPMVSLTTLLALAGGCTDRRWDAQDEETPPETDPTDDDSAGGGDDDSAGSGDDDAGPDPDGLACAPQAPVVFAPWPAGVDLDFNANVHFTDGSVAPGTDGLSWTVLEGPSGGIDSDGTFHSSSGAGGLVRVRVELGSLSATCQAAIVAQIVDNPSGDPLLPSQAEVVTSPNASCAPNPIYPLDGAALPASLGPATWMWDAAPSANATLLRIEGPYVDVTVAPAGSSWSPSEDLWAAIATSAGTDELSVRFIAGLWDAAAGGWTTQPCELPTPRSLWIDDLGAQGSVFYWSPSLQGLMRLDVGAAAPVEFLTASSTGHCIGCHSANLAQPDRMAMTYDGGNGWNAVIEVESPSTFLVPSNQRYSNFSTLSPDGSRIVRTFNGTLYLDSVDTNSTIGTVPTSGHASHPDWSPDGTRLTYVSCAYADSGLDYLVHNCAIRVVDVAPGDTWANDVEIVPAGASNNYYPSFSPDSQWIVFNRSTGDAYDDVDASIWAVPSIGGTPVEFARANSGSNLYNSWPRWVPGPPGAAWITYSSRRAYGNVVSGTPQIWLSYVDLGLLSAGVDPSRAPAWMVGQSTTSGNHTPVWVPRYTPQ